MPLMGLRPGSVHWTSCVQQQQPAMNGFVYGASILRSCTFAPSILNAGGGSYLLLDEERSFVGCSFVRRLEALTLLIIGASASAASTAERRNNGKEEDDDD